ncbi:MAG: hypothetical protein Q8O52_27930 [Sulfuritalea sp.]|nr:hypothetical protein [Sulfuritalea sp.]
MPQVTVACNDAGLRIGESHQNAKLTNREVDTIRDLHESGVGYRRLAAMFEVGKTTIRLIVKCERRAQIATRFRAVSVVE